MGRLSSFLATIGALFCGGAYAQSMPPVRTNIVVLIDVSETWLNDDFRELNEQVLSRVGEGISFASDRLNGPLRVSYFDIGDDSLFRRPLCEAVYQPSLLIREQQGVYSSSDGLRAYLAEDCASYVLHSSPAPLTDITGAIATAVRTQSLVPPERRLVIVLSDLDEDRGGRDLTLTSEDIEGVQFLLLYRSMHRDQVLQSALDARRREWEERLSGLGGDVRSAPDNSITSFEIEQYLLQELR